MASVLEVDLDLSTKCLERAIKPSSGPKRRSPRPYSHPTPQNLKPCASVRVETLKQASGSEQHRARNPKTLEPQETTPSRRYVLLSEVFRKKYRYVQAETYAKPLVSDCGLGFDLLALVDSMLTQFLCIWFRVKVNASV